ncbi:nitrate reductase cytochrome c-type subunit [Ferrimonas lipolytica]|uniref:Periplasmic nitrate reductase, electron transfer subunit n=1 Tax=Ferrimonas lipolytica TaxID=2724191 RepID=A0A6H1UBL3_9GAMM|nr:nitrate reductase cytochrome c-type subunit [Ferrimonas lipolytica]QIZ76477.1 nitrate reductase cytochrome c-type subunit; periplasmic nitrate reductase electron transfer subunit [Ferrimonas lipolytica]
MQRLTLTSAVAASLLLLGCNNPNAVDPFHPPESIEPVYSQRGPTAVADPSPSLPMANYPNKGHTLPRAFENQPPLNPHKPNYQISAKRNTCQSCHGINAKADVPVTHSSHRLDNGELDPHYYFCVQCHVGQADNIEPMVGNSFSAPGYPN